MVPDVPEDESAYRYTEFQRHTKLYDEKDTFGTLWPEDENMNPKWFEKWLDKPGVREHYRTNANTHEGLNSIAEFYGVTNHWKLDEKKMFWENSFELATTIKKHGNGNKHYHLAPFEGGQRYETLLHYSVHSRQDIGEGTLKPGELQLKHLALGLKRVSPSLLKRPPNLEKLNENQRKNGIGDGNMHDTEISITVHYVNDPKTNAEELCKHCQAISYAISVEKQRSTSKDVFAQVEEAVVEGYLENLSQQALHSNPDFRGIECFEQGKLIFKKPDEVKNKWNAESDGPKEERDKFNKWPPVIDNKKFVTFTRNILDRGAQLNAMECFTVPGHSNESPAQVAETGLDDEEEDNASDESNMMSPPFVPGLRTQSHDALIAPGKAKAKGIHCLRVNAKTSNNYFIAPPIILILFATTNNMTVGEAQNSKDFMRTLDYYMRYCIHGNLAANSVDLHGSYKHIYNCGPESHTYNPRAAILGATQLITEMFNSVTARNLDNKEGTERETAWKETLRTLKTAILVMGTHIVGQKNEDTIELLGESRIDVLLQ